MLNQNSSPHILTSPSHHSLPTNPNPNPNPNPNKTTTNGGGGGGGGGGGADMVSLLPPLPRAQSLLHQMSSLTTSLFELSPHRSHWSSSYRSNLPTFLPPNSNSNNPLPPIPSNSSEALSHLSSLQSQLTSTISSLSEISSLNTSISSLTTLLSSSHSSLLSFATTLRHVQSLLDRLLDDYSSLRHSPLDLNDLLSYSHRISYTTFAPPDNSTSSLPPAPQDNQMRASLLYQFADLDVGVPRKDVRTTEDVVSMEEPAAPAPMMLPIAVPPGWKKGMPVELPPDLLAVPPGWKPGDPVPLPLLDGGMMREEQRGVVKAPEAIQVKYVQLDINGDQDESSSDYSSEVGSSDEDDED